MSIFEWGYVFESRKRQKYGQVRANTFLQSVPNSHTKPTAQFFGSFFVSHCFFRFVRFRFARDFQCFASKGNKRKN
jgi:hypothetical protein